MLGTEVMIYSLQHDEMNFNLVNTMVNILLLTNESWQSVYFLVAFLAKRLKNIEVPEDDEAALCS